MTEPDEAIDLGADGADADADAEHGPVASPRGRRRRARRIVPEIPGVEADQVLRVLGAAWRESTDADAPTLLQVMHEGVVRVDVDAVAGYLAVVADGETHRAIGLRRDLVAALVCVLSGRPMDDVRRRLTKGPAKIETAHDDEAAGE